MFDYISASEFLKSCQVTQDSSIKGTVCPWELNKGLEAREDLHDTLQALYLWSRPENIGKSWDNIALSTDYVKARINQLIHEKEPLKSYDSTFCILALHNLLNSTEDSELERIERYAEEYLVRYFHNKPKHNAREYSNPYWKASILYLVLKHKDIDTASLKEWLMEDTNLDKPENEPLHLGRGYQYHHDFFSEFGTKLMARNIILDGEGDEISERNLPDGYVMREYDETPFNSSITFGLSTLTNHFADNNSTKITAISESIFNELENQVFQGGIKRGKYFSIRESWPTFFLYFAEILRERKSVF